MNLYSVSFFIPEGTLVELSNNSMVRLNEDIFHIIQTNHPVIFDIGGKNYVLNSSYSRQIKSKPKKLDMSTGLTINLFNTNVTFNNMKIQFTKHIRGKIVSNDFIPVKLGKNITLVSLDDSKKITTIDKQLVLLVGEK